MRTLILLPLLALFACSEEEKPKNLAVPPPPEGVKEMPKAAAPDDLKLEELQSAAVNTALVPSPAEMQRAMEKAGISKALSGLVPDRKMKMDIENKDVVAVRTGVALADALLTVKEANKDVLVARLDVVKAGMTKLGGGADIQATLDDIKTRVSNESVSRDDLVKELDEMHGAVIPELKYEAGDQVVPLIQAGSWLAGSNLVAQAILDANKPEAADALLRQPQVVEYFQKYVAAQGDGKAPDEVLKQLDATLKTLKDIAAKKTMAVEDVKEVKAQTDSVLALL